MMNNEWTNASTIWESWFFSDNTFSHNHPMFGSSEVWLLQSVGGIQPHPAARGMSHVLIKPSPPSQLTHASTSFATPRGTISTSWSRAGGKLSLQTTIPPNVKATVHVPSRAGTAVLESGQVMLGGRRVEQEGGHVQQDLGEAEARAARGAVVFELGSGEYSFVSTL